MALRTEQIPLYAKFTGTGTAYEPGRILTADFPQGENIGEAAGEVVASPKDYHRQRYGLVGIPHSMFEDFYYDHTRAKVLSQRAAVARFHVPWDGTNGAKADIVVTGVPVDGSKLVIANRNYTFVTTFANADGTIDVSGAPAVNVIAQRIRDAIMGTPSGAGVTYGSGTVPNRHVGAQIHATNNDTVQLFAYGWGRNGNSIVVAESDGDTNITYPAGGFLSGGGQANLAAGEFLHRPDVGPSSNVSPFAGYLLQEGTWTLCGISSKLPVTHANSGIILALDASDLNGGASFALSYTTQGLGMHSKMDSNFDIAVSVAGNATGKTLSARVAAAAAFPAGGYVDLILRRRAV